MAPEEGSDQKPQLDIGAILNQMWVRFLPDIYERVEVLESAAKAHIAGTLSPAQCAAAHAAAHKLIGSLGTFGLMRGTELAREFEQACASENSVMATKPARLDAIAGQIRKIVDERK